MGLRAIVSACLMGVNCSYDGLSRKNSELVLKLKELEAEVLAVCPEVIFGVPRPPLEILGGDGRDFLLNNATIVSVDGRSWNADNLKSFLQELTYWIDVFKPQVAYLRERSPFCGVKQIYDGSFSGKLKSGSGIFTYLLKQKGVRVEWVR